MCESLASDCIACGSPALPHSRTSVRPRGSSVETAMEDLYFCGFCDMRWSCLAGLTAMRMIRFDPPHPEGSFIDLSVAPS